MLGRLWLLFQLCLPLPALAGVLGAGGEDDPQDREGHEQPAAMEQPAPDSPAGPTADNKEKKTRNHFKPVHPNDMRTRFNSAHKHCHNHISERLGHKQWRDGTGASWLNIGMTEAYAPYGGKKKEWENR
jgi:hypothetical protein